jgi:hypothetical protein
MVVPLLLALVTGVTNPCSLLDVGDIARVLGWTVVSGGIRSYHLPSGAGKMCTFEGRDGTVIVTIPSKGTGLPVNDLTTDLGTLRTPLHDAYGLGDPVELGPGAAIVHARGGHDYGITVQPIDAQFADETQMRALATALVMHLPHRHAAAPHA